MTTYNDLQSAYDSQVPDDYWEDTPPMTDAEYEREKRDWAREDGYEWIR